jgi:hypothetical protein
MIHYIIGIEPEWEEPQGEAGILPASGPEKKKSISERARTWHSEAPV